MYGTVARFRVLPGKKDELIRLMAKDNTLAIDGWSADYAFQMDRDSDEFFVVAFFRDKASYVRNADSPAQDARYREWRALLSGDPEWNDGTVVRASGPRAHR